MERLIHVAMNSSRRDLSKIKFVEQEHNDGCAVACVAMCAGLSYKQAVELVHKAPLDELRARGAHALEATFTECVSALRKRGLKCSETKRFSWSSRRSRPAILMFDWPPSWGGGCHGFVLDPRGQVLDPGHCHLKRSEYFSFWKKSGCNTIVFR